MDGSIEAKETRRGKDGGAEKTCGKSDAKAKDDRQEKKK